MAFLSSSSSSLLLLWLRCGLPLSLLRHGSSFVIPQSQHQHRLRRLTPAAAATVGGLNGVTATTSSGSAAQPTTQDDYSNFANFDYLAHWYPVIWADDVRPFEPTKVTLFDVDYVLAKVGDDPDNNPTMMALEDRCPHKAAALSEGRVTSTGKFQCAYHGWSFDGATGACREIPQIVRADGSSPTIAKKSCATAVPVQVHQGMVWLFPGGPWEQALVAPPPPTIAEVETDGFRMGIACRDMPIDWPLVLSNICDADHGLFAHQAKPFDMYSASTEFPLEVEEEFPQDGRGWIARSRTEATDKLLRVDRTLRGVPDDNDPKKKKNDSAEPPYATGYLHTPCHWQVKRVDKQTGKTSFVSAFYLCPVGVGRTRFMSAGAAKVKSPRWITKLLLDNFLDQDTYLLATQQHQILPREAAEIREKLRATGTTGPEAVALVAPQSLSTRRRLFSLQSPTEKLGARLEQFWDRTLLRVPHRIETLLKLDNAGAFLETPPRSFVLDREAQTLAVSPHAQDVVRNCRRLFRGSLVVAGLAVVAQMVALARSAAGPMVLLSRGFWARLAVGCLSVVMGVVGKLMQREYYFKYTEEFRRKDMKNIPSVWIDK